MARDLVERFERARLAQPGRWSASCSSLLQWLDANRQAVQVSASFLEDELALYFGEPFSLEEVKDTVQYLIGEGYVEGTPLEEEIDFGIVRPRLTSKGVACVKKFGGNVAKYEEAQRPAGHVINVKGVNTQISTGDHSNQTMNVGTDAGEILEKVQGLMDIVRGLGYEAPSSTSCIRRPSGISLAASRRASRPDACWRISRVSPPTSAMRPWTWS